MTIKGASQSPKVYVVILNYRGWEDTIECLESIFRADYSNFQVVVIDNHSPNDSVARIRQWAEGKGTVALSENASPEFQYLVDAPIAKPIPYQFFYGQELTPSIIRQTHSPLILVQSEHNGGFAAGNNLFIKHILEEDAYVWLLNPDMVADHQAMSALVAAAQASPAATVIGSVVKSYANPAQVLEFGGCKLNLMTGTASSVLSREEVTRIDYISGGSFFTHLRNFKLYGLLPEEYFLYWEETDWCYRAKKAGVGFTVCESAVCYDKGGTSVGRGFLAEYYYSLNALRFLNKYNPKYIPTVLFFNIFRIGKRLMQGRMNRVDAIIKASTHFVLAKTPSIIKKQ